MTDASALQVEIADLRLWIASTSQELETARANLRSHDEHIEANRQDLQVLQDHPDDDAESQRAQAERNEQERGELEAARPRLATLVQNLEGGIQAARDRIEAAEQQLATAE